MANLVNYNGFDFSTICGGADPFVGISDEQILVGGRFKTLKRVTIQGRIIPDSPSCPNSLTVTSKISTLINSLKNDFLLLNAGGFSLNNARCESIDINQSNFFAGADFTVNFIAYPTSLSNFGFDVLDPVDNKQITENRDGTISLTRSISARGISTSASPNAISNARSFIQSLDAVNSPPSIFFTIGQLTNPGGSLTPRRVVETVNRLEGTVNLDIEYVYRNTAPNNSIILSYTIDVNYDDRSGIYSLSINGNLTGVLDTDQTQLKTALSRLDIFGIAKSKFVELTGKPYLNPEPEQFSIEEDNLNNSIAFSYTYISDPFDVKTSIGYNFSYDRVRDIATVTLNGTLTARGSQKLKKQKLEQALASLNFFGLANAFFSQQNSSNSQPLNPNPVNQNITYNKFEGTTNQIQFDVEFSNQYPVVDSDILRFDYTLSATPSIDVYTPIQFLNGQNGVFNLNFFKRGVISIQGSALAKSSNISGKIRSLALSKLNNFASQNGLRRNVKIEDNITTPLNSDGGYTYNFSISENCETTKYV
jgi:hypothetical protein